MVVCPLACEGVRTLRAAFNDLSDRPPIVEAIQNESWQFATHE